MKKMKTKNVVMVALLSALYLIVYMLSGALVALFGAFGHAISPGICALLSGSIFVFMSRKVGRFGQFTIMTAIVMIIFSIMGAGYLPWIITSMVGAIIADFIASRGNKPAIWKVAIASGILHVGQAWGSIVPSWFFVESYKQEWIERGMEAADMEEKAAATQGMMGVLATAVVFVLAFAGVYLGWLILKKHLSKSED